MFLTKSLGFEIEIFSLNLLKQTKIMLSLNQQRDIQTQIENRYEVKMYPLSSTFQMKILDFYAQKNRLSDKQIESIRNSFHILDFCIITGLTIRYIPNFNQNVYYIHIYRGNDYYYSSENENEIIDSIDTDNAYINNIP
jgi:hypothetical protein